MKKILLSLFTTIIFLSFAEAQFVSSSSLVVKEGPLTDGMHSMHVKIINTGSTPITPNWIAFNENLPGSWVVQFCTDEVCYDANTKSGGYGNPIAPGDSTDITCDFDDDGATSGTGTVQFKLYDPNDTANNVVVNFQYNSWPLSVRPDPLPEVNVFPNPSAKNVTVSIKNILNAQKVQVYDVTGQLVKEVTVTGQQTSFSVSDLESGLYFIRVINTNNDVVAIRRLIRK